MPNINHTTFVLCIGNIFSIALFLTHITLSTNVNNVMKERKNIYPNTPNNQSFRIIEIIFNYKNECLVYDSDKDTTAPTLENWKQLLGKNTIRKVSQKSYSGADLYSRIYFWLKMTVFHTILNLNTNSSSHNLITNTSHLLTFLKYYRLTNSSIISQNVISEW